ncbi:hypothetical protein KJ644_01670 [Candidatus Dependentiae bacterium]|nr:hypothetical protein [Candidatus Dependentiae bacterium]MBU4387160.1 hypothetical protein [Candidatus Dependentiae bacterium]MCG2756745.1 hypothetical protein [Candidatus Dependentiae bacterium]
MKKIFLAILTSITLANSVKAENIEIQQMPQEISQKTTSFKEKMKNLSLSAKEKLVTTFIKSKDFVKNHKKASALIFLTGIITIYASYLVKNHLDYLKIKDTIFDNPICYTKGMDLDAKENFERCLYETGPAISEFYKKYNAAGGLNFKSLEEVKNGCHKVFDFYKLQVKAIIDYANKNGENLSHDMPNLNDLDKIVCDKFATEQLPYLDEATAENMNKLTQDIIKAHSNKLCAIGSKFFNNFCEQFKYNFDSLKKIQWDMFLKWVKSARRSYWYGETN